MVTWGKLWKIKLRACIHAFVLFQNKVDVLFQRRSWPTIFCSKKLWSVGFCRMNVQIHKDTWILDLQNSKMQAMQGIQFIFHFEREAFKLEAGTRNPNWRQKIRTHERRVLNSNKKYVARAMNGDQGGTPSTDERSMHAIPTLIFSFSLELFGMWFWRISSRLSFGLHAYTANICVCFL